MIKVKKKFFHPTISRNAERDLRDLKSLHPSVWDQNGKKFAMDLFRHISTQVPAYKKFLAERQIKPERIRSISDFSSLSLTDKDSYLRKYEYADLFPGRDVTLATTISATSGSTGEPFYFPRGERGDTLHEYLSEIFLRNQFEIERKSTLVIISFGLGIWIGGIVSYKYFNQLARKGHRITIAPVGPDIPLFLKTLKKLGRYYDQVIFVGYPPFLKDMMDNAESEGVDFRDYSIRIIMAAEGFSNAFREYIASKARIKNIYTDIVNIYGTVELSGMANETALSTLVRELAQNNKDLFRALFPGAGGMPTLAQYHPEIVYFEEQDGEIVATGYGSSIPLIRYRFPDMGGVIPFEKMHEICARFGVDVFVEAKRRNIHRYILKLPFVYVHDRSDGAVSLMSINIYPETIRDILNHRELHKYCTGKFQIKKQELENMDGRLNIHVELKNFIRPTRLLEEEVKRKILREMRKYITEFNYLLTVNPKKEYLRIFLRRYHDLKVFASSGKQAWVK